MDVRAIGMNADSNVNDIGHNVISNNDATHTDAANNDTVNPNGPLYISSSKVANLDHGDLAHTPLQQAQKDKLADIFISTNSSGQNTASDWQFSAASVRGLAHQQRHIPCQDRHGYRLLAHNWALAVIADGAGSKSHSDRGAQLVVDQALNYLQSQIEQRFLVDAKSLLPTASELRELADYLYEHLYSSLQAYARQHDICADSLGSTLIATILSSTGVALIHIGDGRAAFQDDLGQWYALMQPWRGEDGYTVFVTTQALRHPDVDLQHYIGITNVQQPIQAVVLMSDGVEHSAFECQVFDETVQRYVRPNRPFANFLNPVKATLNKLHAHFRTDQIAINNRLATFLQQGTETLKKEEDDKTLVFAVYQPLTKLTDHLAAATL